VEADFVMQETHSCNENVMIVVSCALQQFRANDTARHCLCRPPPGKVNKMSQDHTTLLHFLADEAHQALQRAPRAGTTSAIASLAEAEELMAIRINILRRIDNEAQLELPLDLKKAA